LKRSVVENGRTGGLTVSPRGNSDNCREGHHRVLHVSIEQTEDGVGPSVANLNLFLEFRDVDFVVLLTKLKSTKGSDFVEVECRSGSIRSADHRTEQVGILHVGHTRGRHKCFVSKVREEGNSTEEGISDLAGPDLLLCDGGQCGYNGIRHFIYSLC